MKSTWILVLLLGWSFGYSQYQDTLALNKKVLYTAIGTELLLYSGSMAYMNFVWYKDHERVPFHFYNDNLGYLQIDKLGHAYGAFLESDICYHWLLKANVPKQKALLYGATMGLILQTPIEIFDGLYEGWGFSWGDMAANSLGSVFIISQEIWAERRVVNLKFSFKRSEYAPVAHGMLGDNALESLFYDYNGHSYWLSLGLHEFLPLENLPRWIDLSIGYSANGMLGEFENRSSWNGKPLPNVERYRQFFISLDLDWSEIPIENKFLKSLFNTLNYVKIPFPAIEFNHIDKINFKPFYF